jgi:hypothetical protein
MTDYTFQKIRHNSIFACANDAPFVALESAVHYLSKADTNAFFRAIELATTVVALYPIRSTTVHGVEDRMGGRFWVRPGEDELEMEE